MWNKIKKRLTYLWAVIRFILAGMLALVLYMTYFAWIDWWYAGREVWRDMKFELDRRDWS